MPIAISTNTSDSNFENLIDIDEIRESLRLLDEQENQIDASLDELLKQEYQLDNSLNTFKAVK
jgi:t-SNARE complex subunit (syntaxin)